MWVVIAPFTAAWKNADVDKLSLKFPRHKNKKQPHHQADEWQTQPAHAQAFSLLD